MRDGCLPITREALQTVFLHGFTIGISTLIHSMIHNLNHRHVRCIINWERKVLPISLVISAVHSQRRETPASSPIFKILPVFHRATHARPNPLYLNTVSRCIFESPIISGVRHPLDAFQEIDTTSSKKN